MLFKKYLASINVAFKRFMGTGQNLGMQQPQKCFFFWYSTKAQKMPIKMCMKNGIICNIECIGV